MSEGGGVMIRERGEYAPGGVVSMAFPAGVPHWLTDTVTVVFVPVLLLQVSPSFLVALPFTLTPNVLLYLAWIFFSANQSRSLAYSTM